MAHFQYLPNPLFSRRTSFLRMLSCNKTTKTGYKQKHSQYKIQYKLFSVFSGKTVANITLKTTAHRVWNLHTLKNKYDLTLSIMFTHCLRNFRPSKKKMSSFFCIRASILRCIAAIIIQLKSDGVFYIESNPHPPIAPLENHWHCYEGQQRFSLWPGK